MNIWMILFFIVLIMFIIALACIVVMVPTYNKKLNTLSNNIATHKIYNVHLVKTIEDSKITIQALKTQLSMTSSMLEEFAYENEKLKEEIIKLKKKKSK